MIVAISGENKTGKTTLALTFPKKIYHVELDVGGFSRAAPRFMDEIKLKQIVSVSYPMPQQYIRDKIMGKLALGKLKVEQPQRLVGIKELWYRLLGDLIVILEKKSFATVVIDSFPQLWELCRLAFLQEKQELQFDPLTSKLKASEKLRESLQPEEYSEPNARIRSLLYAFREQNVNLVLSIFMDDKYEKKLVQDKGDTKVEDIITGRKMAGWNPNNVTKEVDLVLENTVITLNHAKNETPKFAIRTTVLLSGLGLQLRGQSFIDPTYQMIMNAREMLQEG